jgi:hypothetical protein
MPGQLTANAAGTWRDWREASCMPERCFCESVGVGVVRQPANSLSSGAFVIVAILALWQARTFHGTRRRVEGQSAVRFAVAVALVGLGSSFFHASLTFWGQTADVLGMYLVATFLLLESVAQRSQWSARQHDARFWGGNAVLLAVLIGLPGLRRYLFAVLVGAILWSEWRNVSLARASGSATPRVATPRVATPLVLAVGVLAVGFAVWVLDITGVVCSPDSPLQGHALWHLCGALSTWMAYRAIGHPARRTS